MTFDQNPTEAPDPDPSEASDRNPSEVPDRSSADPSSCSEPDCEREAAFFVYTPESERWRAICHPHARHLHPSLEVHAWLESGYMKPIELGKPDGSPSAPRGGRAEAFRTEVEKTMGWTE